MCGQFLSMSVFRAIGNDGVFYGTRLGKVIPWYTGFPYDTVPHAQYVGAVLTFWGGFLFLMTMELIPDFILFGFSIVVFYTVTALLEDHHKLSQSQVVPHASQHGRSNRMKKAD